MAQTPCNLKHRPEPVAPIPTVDIGERSYDIAGHPQGVQRKTLILAALKANIKITNPLPPDPGRDRPKTSDFPKEMLVRTLPRGKGKNKI